MKNLTLLNLEEDTIDKFKKCFDLNGSPKKEENIEWQFFQNTESNCFVEIAFDEQNNKTAGIYAVSCVKFKVGDNNYLGTQSLDTITDIDYRGKGLFILLSNNVYKNADNGGVALVYGFPNGNSIHGFVKKLEWNVLDPVPFLIKPLKSKYFTDKIKPIKFLPNLNLSFSKLKKSKRYSISEETNFPSEVNKIWKQFSSHFKVAIVRDQNYLNWRYIKKPNENYRIAHCRNQNNEYVGFIVFAIKEKHNGKIGYIMEFIYNPVNVEVGKLLLNYSINAIKKENADCVLAWCLEHSPNYSMLKKEFFFNMPDKLRPIELHFGARCFNTELKEEVYNRENWYISYSDSDTV